MEKTFITTTPAMINKIPKIAGKSNDCLKIKTETKAVKTIPKPAHIAYANPKGIDFKACERKKKQPQKATTVMIEGTNFENPSDVFKKLEPITSNVIANPKNRYFILSNLMQQRNSQTRSDFLMYVKIGLPSSDTAEGFLGDAEVRRNVSQTDAL